MRHSNPQKLFSCKFMKLDYWRTLHEIHNFRINPFPKTCQKSYIEVSLSETFNILGPSA